MNISLFNSKSDNSESTKLECDRIPNECPICHTGIVPKKRVGVRRGTKEITILFQCVRDDCQSCFISRYVRDETGRYIYKGSLPRLPQGTEIPTAVRDISPDFIEIYTQTIAAETYGLDQIMGMGLRKALEFLIKDFAVERRRDEEDRIRSKRLGQCIEDYIDDHRLKGVAKRANWLGDDETHYTRRWEEMDIKHLKTLIKLTVMWIDSILETEKFESLMPDDS